MTRNYYYLVAGLPDLFLDQDKKDFSYLRLKEEVMENVHPADYEQVELLHLPYDNENFLNSLFKRNLSFTPLGKYPKELFDELDESITLLPAYMQEFYKDYTGKGKDDEEELPASLDEPNLNPEVKFNNLFYSYVLKRGNKFIADWYSFLRDYQNILSALSARKLGVDIAGQLVGDSPMVEALTRSQAPDFGLKREVEYIDKLLQITEASSLLEREKHLDVFKWDIADDLAAWDYFNINKVMSFLIKANIINRWSKLDPAVGEQLFQKLVTDLQSSYQVSNK
ncbi:MAG: DUF2764 family protein [Bacteroidales bacterium]|nr:DUF2764 family protein [Bacteroidales bacterium]MBN2747854.1 DUF2764 family protein [Bacteroidales bacterium]